MCFRLCKTVGLHYIRLFVDRYAEIHIDTFAMGAILLLPLPWVTKALARLASDIDPSQMP